MTSTNRYNYYDILELPTNAAQHEVTTAYERARATYSGENQAIYTIFSQQEARELLSMIEEAYSVLGNKTLRGIYDQRLFSNSANQQDLTYSSLLLASKVNLPEPKQEEKKPVYEIDDEIEKEINERTEWDGDGFRKIREYKKLSLASLSEKTKIKSFYLNAIENMSPKELPAEVFVRGYVIQLAKELGINEKAAADSYMKLFKAKASH